MTHPQPPLTPSRQRLADHFQRIAELRAKVKAAPEPSAPEPVSPPVPIRTNSFAEATAAIKEREVAAATPSLKLQLEAELHETLAHTEDLRIEVVVEEAQRIASEYAMQVSRIDLLERQLAAAMEFFQETHPARTIIRVREVMDRLPRLERLAVGRASWRRMFENLATDARARLY